jgi:hypothetical protein
MHSFSAWWVEHRKEVVKDRRKAFDSLVIAVAWSIWLQRNERCFARSCNPPAPVSLEAGSLLEVWSRVGM